VKYVAQMLRPSGTTRNALRLFQAKLRYRFSDFFIHKPEVGSDIPTGLGFINVQKVPHNSFDSLELLTLVT
jgi:hypothetical protein